MKEQRMFDKFTSGSEPFVSEKNSRNAKCKCGSDKKQKHCCGCETKYFTKKK